MKCCICGRDLTGQPAMVDRATGEAFCSNDSQYFGLHPSNRPRRPARELISGLSWSSDYGAMVIHPDHVCGLKGFSSNASLAARMLRPHALEQKLRSIGRREGSAEKLRDVLEMLRTRCWGCGEDIYAPSFEEAWSKAPRVLGYKRIRIFMSVDFGDKYRTLDSLMQTRRYTDHLELREVFVRNAVDLGLPVRFLAKDGAPLLTL